MLPGPDCLKRNWNRLPREPGYQKQFEQNLETRFYHQIQGGLHFVLKYKINFGGLLLTSTSGVYSFLRQTD